MIQVGVCISTTPAENEKFCNTYDQWDRYLPPDAILTYVVDEAGAGVAKTKNASLALLESLGVTDYFLADSDCYPIAEDWWKPYVEHPEPHLMYQFKLPGKAKTDMQELYRDETTVAYSHTRGAMIYISKKVLDIVGGFDEAYGLYGYEHPDYTNRIHNAGLTTHRSMDVPNSHELFYCLDQDKKAEPLSPERHKSMRKNAALYRRNKKSNEYKDFK